MVGGPATWYSPAIADQRSEEEQRSEPGQDATACCHGDDFLAEGFEEQLLELNSLLEKSFEVTRTAFIGPGKPGQVKYLKRIIGYTETLPDDGEGGGGEPGFFWAADSKHVDYLIKWSRKRGSKTPGTKATGVGQRDSFDEYSREKG